MKRFFWILIAMFLLCGCSVEQNKDAENGQNDSGSSVSENTSMFSERDFKTEYDQDKSAVIALNGSSAECSSDAVSISGSTITIKDEGTYLLSGTLDDGMIVINAEKEDKVQIVLDGVQIHSKTCAPIYIIQSDKVFITLREGSKNVLSNGGSFEMIDENNIDAVIFSKEDLTINGSGSLMIESPGGHGVVCKDELTITGGYIEIDALAHGLTGKDGICLANAEFLITSGKDAIHAENDEDASLGYLYIESGTFDLDAQGDGLSASSVLTICDGSFDILAGGGSVNAQSETSDFWGGMHHSGRGNPNAPSNASSTDTEDSASAKGIKAVTELNVDGGEFVLDTADDAIHSNGNITITGGNFVIASGDDGFHADDTLTIKEGCIVINESYEGLEGLHILVSGGDITLKSSDDGLNAAGGMDASGTGGFGGHDQFRSSSNGSIVISGGNLYVHASGDGIDANGTLEISGGHTIVVGPTQGDTATLDYDISAVISGGTFIGTGSSMMAQTFSDSSQGVISLQVGSQRANTEITLTNAANEQIVSYAPELSFAVVIISTEEMIQGESYTITVGSASGTFEAQ